MLNNLIDFYNKQTAITKALLIVFVIMPVSLLVFPLIVGFLLYRFISKRGFVMPSDKAISILAICLFTFFVQLIWSGVLISSENKNSEANKTSQIKSNGTVAGISSDKEKSQNTIQNPTPKLTLTQQPTIEVTATLIPTIQPTAEPTATEIPTPTIIPTTIVTVLPTHYEFIIPTNLPTQLVLPTAISTPKQIVIEQPKTNTNACKYSCTGPDVDCKDFTNSDDAQAYYKCCQFSPDNDPMDLDRDNDYLACEKN